MKKKKYLEPELELFRLQFAEVLNGSINDPYNPEIGVGGGDEGEDGDL